MFRQLFGRSSRPDRDPVDAVFGALEQDVLGVLWAEADLAVRDVQIRLQRGIAYTTVMTTLDRLFKKGVLSRRRSGRAFRYSTAMTREQLNASIAGRLLSTLLDGRQDATLPVLSKLVDSVGGQSEGAELLQKLEAMVRDKRRQLTSQKPR